jgi:hypothetical protein
MDADTLRLILIVVGTVLVLALYLWERSRSEEDEDEPDTPSGQGKREPTVGAVDPLHPADPLDPAPAADPEEVAVEVKGRGWAAAVATFQAASRRADTVPQAALHLVADASEPDPDEPGGANTLILQVGVRVRAGEISGPDLLDVAAHCGLRTFGMSVVTDLCLPDSLQPANIEHIIATANSAAPKLRALVCGVLAYDAAKARQ